MHILSNLAGVHHGTPMQQPGLHSGIPRQGVSSQQRHVLRPDNQFIHTYTLKTVKFHLHTFLPWANAWERLFQACFLSSVNLMEAHRAPKSTQGWDFMDQDQETFAAKQVTLSQLFAGIPPRPTKRSSFQVLVGMSLAALEYCPSLLESVISKRTLQN